MGSLAFWLMITVTMPLDSHTGRDIQNRSSLLGGLGEAERPVP